MEVSVSEGLLWAGLTSQFCSPGPRIGTFCSCTDSGRGGPGVPEMPRKRAREDRKHPRRGPGPSAGAEPESSVCPPRGGSREGSLVLPPLPHRWRLPRSHSPPVHLWSRCLGSGGTRRAEHRCPCFRVTWEHPWAPSICRAPGCFT